MTFYVASIMQNKLNESDSFLSGSGRLYVIWVMNHVYIFYFSGKYVEIQY